MYYVSSIEAKKDERIRNSGNIINFELNGYIFDKNPTDYFYNWIYINALSQNEDMCQEIMEYDSFTDIEFNPKKELNCQAAAAARFVGLKKSGNLNKALESPSKFLEIVYPNMQEEKPRQLNIFDN